MRKCAICGKTSKMAGTRYLLRGHYNPTNWSRKYPNLQITKTPEGERVLACTQCIRTFGKAARIDKKQKDKEAKKVSDAAKKAEAAAKPAEPKKEEKPKKESKAKKAEKKTK